MVVMAVVLLGGVWGAKKKYKVVKENGKVSIVYKPYFRHGNRASGTQYYRAEYSTAFTDLSRFTHSELLEMAEGGLYEPCFRLKKNQSVEACFCAKDDLVHGWKRVSTLTIRNAFICVYIPIIIIVILTFFLRFVLPTLGVMYSQVIMVLNFHSISETKIEANIRKMVQSNLPGVHEESKVVTTRWPPKDVEVKSIYALQDVAKDRLVADQ